MIPGVMAVGMLLMGGAVGTLYDRVVFHAVRDFIDVVIPLVKYDYLVFNVADVFIVAGVIVFFLEPYLVKLSARKAPADG